MSTAADEFLQLVISALDTLRGPPKDLSKVIEFVASANDAVASAPLEKLKRHLAQCGPNDRVRHSLTIRLQRWDHEERAAWSKSTEPHSSERRADALRLLGFNASEASVVNDAIPIFAETEIPTVIAQSHTHWYEARKAAIASFYWEHYKGQLRKPPASWSAASIAALDSSTDDVIARLSDPTREEIYQVKGLVMGYVQSGKTSHFSGLIAKAADAGYRMIVVLAGTMDILRQQTQRRIDKEIVGKEILTADEYGQDSDWASFVEHGGLPSELGYFDWTRLTNRENDYSKLKQHLPILDFKREDTSKPFNHPQNLSHAPARLVVIKKIPNRISKLCDDLESLKGLRSKLEYVPTLIIDDESDQASINVVDRNKTSEKDARSSTNRAIGRLLKLLPRAQYVGYTATPFANVFIDPEDAEDLFPKDFIVSLPRPEGYMGVADFYDFDSELPEGDLRRNREAFVRFVEGENDADSNLPKAIDSFVLAGAIKLYRESRLPGQYRFKHHTMLVHHSPRRMVHKEDADEVIKIFGGGARYQTRAGLRRLEVLFESDFKAVARLHGSDAPFPKTFETLKPFISACVTRICDERPVLIVNGDNKDDTPDFDATSVWAILVGGAKLSRGYTVEGLTTSYFRRPAGAADTLMQMGRWFGFRPGYRDLVRLYVGKNERRGKGSIDLYEAFGGVCRDEEALRNELRRYAKGGITPKQVPPLVHQHLPYLPPASKSKMFNAQIRAKDFAGEWTEKTTASNKVADIRDNLRAAGTLLESGTSLGRQTMRLTNEDGKKRAFDAYCLTVGGKDATRFLSAYKWAENRQPLALELEYLRKRMGDGALHEWLVVLPLIASDVLKKVGRSGLPPIPVIERLKDGESRFKVYSEPRHRDVAQYATGILAGTQVSEFLKSQRDKARPVLMMYLVRETGVTRGDPTVGFGIQYPGIKKQSAITWSVVDKRDQDAVVVSRRSGRVKC